MSIIACIGSGNMGFALMKNSCRDNEIFFTDADKVKAQNAADSLGAKV